LNSGYRRDGTPLASQYVNVQAAGQYFPLCRPLTKWTVSVWD